MATSWRWATCQIVSPSLASTSTPSMLNLIALM